MTNHMDYSYKKRSKAEAMKDQAANKQGRHKGAGGVAISHWHRQDGWQKRHEV